jgi:hypothetical protein|tara:strand:+ start:944 stop:1618 length:675 start_codon:yes stop_codon:yes gene_type:complete
MELSENTLQILKNYAGINSNIVFNEGNNIQTISEAKNVLSAASTVEDFPQNFGIYDLNEFLNVLGLVDVPNLSFEKDYVLISDSSGRSKVKYFFSDPDMLTSPSKKIVMPQCEVQFTLDANTLSRIKRAAAALGHDEVSITPGNGHLTLSVVDSKNATSNTFAIDIAGNYPEDPFNFVISISNLKIIPGDYHVAISSKLISEFSNNELGVSYWIALEKSSTYGE